MIPFTCVGKALLLFAVLVFGLSFDAAAGWEDLPPWAVRPPWPNRLQLERPDPITGAADAAELWAYTESFAERFRNLPKGEVRGDLPAGLFAVAFRIFPTAYYSVENRKQSIYWCAMDLYLAEDVAARITPAERSRGTAVPAGVNVADSFGRLEPVADTDREALPTARRGTVRGRDWAVVFLDGVLDARFARLNMSWSSTAPKGMRVVTLQSDASCQFAWPWRNGQRYVISLLGNDPYRVNQLNEQAKKAKSPLAYLYARQSADLVGAEAEYRWRPEDSENGLFALPEDFVQRMLHKVLAAKALNICIDYEKGAVARGYARVSPEWYSKRVEGCRRMRETGEVYYAPADKFEFDDAAETRGSNSQSQFNP